MKNNLISFDQWKYRIYVALFQYVEFQYNVILNFQTDFNKLFRPFTLRAYLTFDTHEVKVTLTLVTAVNLRITSYLQLFICMICTVRHMLTTCMLVYLAYMVKKKIALNTTHNSIEYFNFSVNTMQNEFLDFKF